MSDTKDTKALSYPKTRWYILYVWGPERGYWCGRIAGIPSFSSSVYDAQAYSQRAAKIARHRLEGNGRGTVTIIDLEDAKGQIIKMSDTTRPVREILEEIAYIDGTGADCPYNPNLNRAVSLAREALEVLAIPPDPWHRRPVGGWTAETLPYGVRPKVLLSFNGDIYMGEYLASSSRVFSDGDSFLVAEIDAWMYVPEYADAVGDAGEGESAL